MLAFLHGFLDSTKDWYPLKLPGTFLTLPGHQGRPPRLSPLEIDISKKPL